MRNKILTLAVLLGLAVSCQDAYEIEQPGFRTEDSQIFNSSADIARGINALYNQIPVEAEINFVSYFTDELGPGRDNAGQGINDGSYRFFMNPGTGFAGAYWNNLYNLVNRANRLMHRIDELTAKLDPSDEQNAPEITALTNAKARLYVLRAYAHLQLFAYYTPDYTNGSGLSVIKFDFYQTDDYKRYEKRSTVNEIVSFIEKDIQTALDMTNGGESLDTKVGAINDNNFIGRNVAYAILVKLYAMTQNPSGVLTNIDMITDKNIGTYESFSTLFAKEEIGLATNPDLIWRLVRLPNDGGGVAGAWWAGAVATNRTAYMEIGRSLFNELDALHAERFDYRYDATVLAGSTPDPNYMNLDPNEYLDNDLLFIGKYPGSTGAPLQNDIKVIRYTDLYLAKAEAYAMNGNYQGVEDIIRDIRAARTFGDNVNAPAIANVQQAWNAILKERRIEFAFEGARYLDMKRLGVKAGSAGFVRNAKDCETNDACSLEATSYKLTLPIPRSEMLSNPNMVQNPGY